MKFRLIAIAFVAVLFLTSFVIVDGGNTVTDRNGNVYSICKIGQQEWLTSNLQATKFRNGESIPHAQNYKQWNSPGPQWCYYHFEEKYGKTYGILYNWEAIIDPRGIGPKGWHVPTRAEWQTLLDSLGGDSIAVVKLKSTSGWKVFGYSSLEDGMNGTNASGFNALPGGEIMDVGSSTGVELYSKWATSTHLEGRMVDAFWLRGNSNQPVFDDELERGGFYVRLVKDK